MGRTGSIITCLLGGICLALGAEKAPLDLVDPTIGTTHCRWFFFTPGARPFGMAKPGPCTDAHYGNYHGWEAVGYDSRHDSIESFVSFREFQIGGVAVMATTGDLETVPGDKENPESGYRSRFDKETEVAKAGCYSVYLKDYGVTAELTATPRVAFHRFTFTNNSQGHIIFDVGNRQGEGGPVLDAAVRRSGPREIEGFVVTHPRYIWAYQPGAVLKMYFVAELDQEPVHIGAFRGTNVFADQFAMLGEGAGLYADFAPGAGAVTVKLGMSYTGIENARTNLRKEAGGLGFDQARKQAQDAWSEMLGRIAVKGGKESDRVKFYTGLYHALLGRGLASDCNGAYPKNDGGVGRIIALGTNGVPLYNHYNSDSVWGSFWNLNQLWALAYPEYLSEYVRCHLDHYRDCGWLPDSIAAAKFVSGVGTDFTGLLISGAYNVGIRDYDVNQAFAAVLKNEIGWENRPIGVGKADLKSFVDRGYIPYIEKVAAFSAATAEGSQFSASHTLEYSFSSWAAAQFAKTLGKTNEYEKLIKNSKGWERLYDPETDFVRPRDLSGEFIKDFDPRKPWVGFQEGNAWQYTFYVPQDLPGLIQKMGIETFQSRLSQVFTMSEKTDFGGGKKLDAFSGLQNVYNHGNQPALHIAWLFNYCGQPWETQHWIRRICDVFYGTDRVHGYGYGQDEDQGQLGAWYVLASLGLFDVQGGTAPEPVFQMAAPFFQEATIQLNPRYHEGKTFKISVQGDPATHHYIKSARINGNLLQAAQVPWKQVLAGETLEVSLASEPIKTWGGQSSSPR